MLLLLWALFIITYVIHAMVNEFNRHMERKIERLQQEIKDEANARQKTR